MNNSCKEITFKEKLLKEYFSAIDIGISKYNSGNLNDSLAYYSYASTIAWKYPILENYIDDNLEHALGILSARITNYPLKELGSAVNKRVVLYSTQLVDKGGLTEQYLYTLAQLGFEVLLIVPELNNTKNGKSILKFVKSNYIVELFTPISNTLVDKIREIGARVADYNPDKIFLHFQPNDVVGFCSFFQSPKLKFFIVHNDHTFWLGKNCANFFIEFRDFGVSLSVNRRGIETQRILHIPFYPIINENETFEGFPFNKENKIVGVSGANLYKYYFDNDLKYFQVIKELINENTNFVFCLCGWGDETIVKKFIIENNLKDKFFFLGKREDFSSVVANSDILFESYPLKGGLVPLFANFHSKPIIGISDFQGPSGSIEDFLSINGYNQPTSLEEFKAEAKRLITDMEYRRRLVAILGKNRFNKNDFIGSITKLMQNEVNGLVPLKINTCKINNLSYLKYYTKNPIERDRIDAWDKLINLRGVLSLRELILTIKCILANTKSNRMKTFARIILMIVIGRQRI